MIIIPRLFSSYGTHIGTVCILLYWVGMLAIMPDFIEGFDSIKTEIQTSDKLLVVSVLFFATVCFLSFLYKEIIYTKKADLEMVHVRRALYILNPMACVIWIYNIDQFKRKRYLITVAILTFSMAIAIVGPGLFNKLNFSNYLNSITALISSKILEIFSQLDLVVDESFIVGRDFSLKVDPGCNSVTQIFVSVYSIIICLTVCRISSYLKILFVFIAAIFICFFSNSIRIAILGWFVSTGQMNSFDFWHEGTGSLLFSLCSMTITCCVYYFFWSKENPVIKRLIT